MMRVERFAGGSVLAAVLFVGLGVSGGAMAQVGPQIFGQQSFNQPQFGSQPFARQLRFGQQQQIRPQQFGQQQFAQQGRRFVPQPFGSQRFNPQPQFAAQQQLRPQQFQPQQFQPQQFRPQQFQSQQFQPQQFQLQQFQPQQFQSPQFVRQPQIRPQQFPPQQLFGPQPQFGQVLTQRPTVQRSFGQQQLVRQQQPFGPPQFGPQAGFQQVAQRPGAQGLGAQAGIGVPRYILDGLDQDYFGGAVTPSQPVKPPLFFDTISDGQTFPSSFAQGASAPIGRTSAGRQFGPQRAFGGGLRVPQQGPFGPQQFGSGQGQLPFGQPGGQPFPR